MEEASTDLFINLIQNNRIVYDKSLKDFKNVRKKEEAWVNIAKQCRMTVDATKKRYFSLRQKYCREKKNAETKRRKKIVHRSGWVFYDRLQFLDPYIQPRSTFTNDTEFVEDSDDGNGMEVDGDEDCQSQGVRIEVDPSIDAEEINDLLDGTTNEIPETFNEQSEDADFVTESVLSEYTGEISQILYLSNASQNDVLREVQEPDNIETVAEPTDDDNYMSLNPTTSFSTQRFAKPFPVDKSRPIICGQKLSMSVGLSGCGSSSQSPDSQQPASQRISSTSKNTAVRENVNKSKRTSVAAPSSGNGVSSHVVAATAATTSNEKSIDSIRQKMNSCLDVLANKMTEKSNRSPHAPFLAYLGTKLPRVPQEILPGVEQEILEIVKFYSK